jgi:hypothetical protein
MTAMHAVEIADCHNRPFKPWGRRLRIENNDKFFCRRGFYQGGPLKRSTSGPESRKGNPRQAFREAESMTLTGMASILGAHINRIASETTFNPSDGMTTLRQAPAPCSGSSAGLPVGYGWRLR